MKKTNHKKPFITAIIGIILTFSVLSAAKASAAPPDTYLPAQPTTEKPLPGITPPPGIQPLDDFPGKKDLG